LLREGERMWGIWGRAKSPLENVMRVSRLFVFVFSGVAVEHVSLRGGCCWAAAWWCLLVVCFAAFVEFCRVSTINSVTRSAPGAVFVNIRPPIRAGRRRSDASPPMTSRNRSPTQSLSVA